MSSSRNQRYLALDFELTCWEGEPPDGMRPEIIEMGIVEVATASHVIEREARYLVKPGRSTISPFCESLTGISPAEMKKHGRPLAEVLGTLKAFGPTHKKLVTWGDDWGALERDCLDTCLVNPFPRSNLIDIASLFALVRVTSARSSLEEALGAFGLAFEGRKHGALVDAKNTVRLFAAMLEAMRGDIRVGDAE